ncbi:S8 family serine peptidase [Brevibacterium jeotgali]|uniref:Subtilase family protein n=1 Tax=Brevibacterium jeotgali TaxID=1262550 RepID=A0A2H1L7U5_9MICO|nr:S8 family serine peptidase [Brevibacterium jeotgali]TWB99040.1 subtilase family protein [Brevibacterium jeotgali]SMY12453.1 Subtilase family protein [Brevibacterium jeotgali]
MSRRSGNHEPPYERRRRRERGRRLRARVLQLLAILAALGLVAATIFGGSASAAEALTNDEAEPGPGQWFMDDYDIPELWETTRGDGVTVAVIDSGVNDDHENLSDRVTASRDFSGAGKDGTEPVGAESIIHHGTAVAGVVAGSGTGSGPMGVAPEAKIASASVWLGGGAPSAAQSTRVQAERALRWAVDSDASVINMSLGWDDPSWPQTWDEAFAYAYEHDAVVIACVGNRSQGATQAWSPATVPGVVGVGGLTQSGAIRDTSTAPGTAVDLMGPAEDIPVPFWDGGYGTADGCSFAAPVVSGIAALLRSAHPDWSADEVVAALNETAGAVEGYEGQGTYEEPDPIVGYGRIDPAAALEWEPDDDVPSAGEQLSEWVQMHRRGEADSESARAGEESAAAQDDATHEAGRSDGTVAAAHAPRQVLGPSVLIGGGVIGAALLTGALVVGVRARRAGQDPVRGSAKAGAAAEPPAGAPAGVAEGTRGDG